MPKYKIMWYGDAGPVEISKEAFDKLSKDEVIDFALKFAKEALEWKEKHLACIGVIK